MATKALTAVGQRASRNRVPATIVSRRGGDWRETLISQDADAIWRKLFALVRTNSADKESSHDLVTQEVFLLLISTGRIDMYLENGYSSHEIRLDLISLLPT